MAKRKALRWAGLCGVLGPMLILILIVAAMALAPGWSITDNSISRLAGGPGDTPTWSATGAPAILLNAGLMMTGSMMAYFSWNLRYTSYFPGRAGGLGRAVLLIACLFMFLIGVFPLTTGVIHDFVSYTFFILTALSLIILGASMMKVPERKRDGYLLVALGIMVVMPFLVPRPFKGIAIPEFLGLVPLTAFAMVVGLKMAVARLE